MAAVTAVLTVVQAYLMVDLICKVFQRNQSFHQLGDEVWFLLCVFLMRSALALFNDRIVAAASNKMRGELRSEVVRKTLENNGTDAADIGATQLALLVSKGINNLDSYFAKFLPQLFIASIVPIVVGACIAWRDWESGGIILLTLPLIPIFGIMIGKFTASSTSKKWQTLGVLSNYFIDLISGLSTLKVYGRDKLQSKRIKEVGDKYRNETMKVLRVSFLSSLALELVATLSVALLAVTIGLRLVHGSMPLSAGLFVLVLAPEVYWPIRQVSAYFHAAADGIATFDQLFAIFEKQPITGTLTPRQIDAIEWSELTIDYPDRTRVTIPSGRAEVGSIHAILGPSGAGKSTLARILLGFLTPTQGRVIVHSDLGAVSFEGLNINQWRELVAWQPQEPKFPIGTVAQIFRHADPQASDDELIQTLQSVELNIDDLPHGLLTELGTVRQKLSIGQLRKIALARAILKRAPLLILDEPTASVDDVSETAIAELLRQYSEANSIVILISHRDSLIDYSHSSTLIGSVG